MKKDDVAFRMGANIRDIVPGDAVKVGSRLEVIASITPRPGSNWDKDIETDSGRTYNMMEINAYGKRVEPKD